MISAATSYLLQELTSLPGVNNSTPTVITNITPYIPPAPVDHHATLTFQQVTAAKLKEDVADAMTFQFTSTGKQITITNTFFDSFLHGDLGEAGKAALQMKQQLGLQTQSLTTQSTVLQNYSTSVGLTGT